MPTHEELLNVYDASGAVIGTRRRIDPEAPVQIAGAVNALLISSTAEVLLQRRSSDKENGGLWDKSVGGHVGAGEDFDDTLIREAGEELFDDPRSPRVRLVSDQRHFQRLKASLDLSHAVLLQHRSLQLNLRDVRHAPGRSGVRNTLYHVAIYLGCTDVPIDQFRPQESEIDALRYVAVAELDRLLLQGALAPNMAFLWLSQGRAVLDLVERGTSGARIGE